VGVVAGSVVVSERHRGRVARDRDQVYGWGFSCQYVTDFYADGFPRTWTVLPSSATEHLDGQREAATRSASHSLIRRRIVQIDRNPGPACTAPRRCRAYAQVAYGLWLQGTSR
jgi:hypothetical protein